MSATPGLRERKKQKTRDSIAETARRMFIERGFERVTVAEIADEAEVSEATVFNYFPTKEDLFFHGMQTFEEEMAQAIRERPAGESIVDAFGRFATEPRGFLASSDPGAAEGLRAVTRVIAESPALLARERAILEGYIDTLAQLIAEESGVASDALEPRVIAGALIALHRALIGYVRRRALAGDEPRYIARGVRTQGRRALSLLTDGLESHR
jgi:AcrR family transcriptional regulator